MSVWTGIPERPTAQDWEDVRLLLGSGAVFGVGASAEVPEGWPAVESAGGVQLTGEHIEGAPDPEVVELTPDDVPRSSGSSPAPSPGRSCPARSSSGATSASGARDA
ncbi:hypothetical protein P9139_03500 [Curtobacterium flaccumfaciens]|nr:hypothetical protein P9139_03500 [Curtobacterium flaccumfaciens]